MSKRDAGACIKCGAIPSVARESVGSGWRTLWWCYRCNDLAFGGDSWLPNKRDLMQLPIVSRKADEPCQVLRCLNVGQLEEHHLAPYEFFGDDADRWPTIRVCKRCHDKWHDTINAGRATPRRGAGT